MKRVPLLPAVRKSVKKKYGNRCARCQEQRPLVIHHKQPLSEGGTDTLDNLIALCWPCHKLVHQERGDDYADMMAESPSLLGETHEGATAVFEDGLRKLPLAKLSGVACRVLLYAMANTFSRNYVAGSQKEMARVLGTSASSISKAIKELCIAGAFRRDGRMLQIHPDVAWKGDFRLYWELRASMARLSLAKM